MALVRAHIYLEARQMKALAIEAKRRGRRPCDLMREAVDAIVMGVDVQDLRLLDAATLRAKADLDAIVEVLDANAREHRSFMSEIARLRRDTADTRESQAAARRSP